MKSTQSPIRVQAPKRSPKDVQQNSSASAEAVRGSLFPFRDLYLLPEKGPQVRRVCVAP